MSRVNIVHLKKKLTCPDELLLERYRRNPELGPRIQFFSGGTALKPLSVELTQYTHNTVHLITPFDSGGSSYHLRKAFNMLAVGDFRNRVMALADKDFRGNPNVVSLFSHRLSQSLSQDELADIIESMINGEHELVQNVPGPLKIIIRSNLRIFYEHMPQNFDLRGANIGNLVLVGGYINHDRQLDPVLYLFSRLVEVRGIVRPVSTENLHLAVELENGEFIVGQHLITDSNQSSDRSKIKELFLNNSLENVEKTSAEVDPKIVDQISSVDLICYPFGSFYTSVLACLSLENIGKAIAKNKCPKVYIPNLRGDIEQRGMSVNEEVEKILATLKTSKSACREVLDIVLLDDDLNHYDRNVGISGLESLGIQVIQAPLVSKGQFLSKNLISLLLALST